MQGEGEREKTSTSKLRGKYKPIYYICFCFSSQFSPSRRIFIWKLACLLVWNMV